MTTLGRLIGVVGLKELRKAIEDANSGQVPEKRFDEETGEDDEEDDLPVKECLLKEE